MEYSEYIKMLNSGLIIRFVFEISGYKHYSNCEINYSFLLTPSKKKIYIVKVILTKDKSEMVSFPFKFDENYKLFKIGKNKYTLKQIWDKVIIKSIDYA